LDTFYWKDRDLEVDFVALGPNHEKWAIEVKSATASEKDFKGLRAFVKQYPDFEPVSVSLTGQSFPGIRPLKAEEILSFSRQYQ
jgi:predicted AAA+ superfamily ATPase